MRVKVVNGIVGEGVGFERLRRITGYLTGNLSCWNDAKRSEEKDRLKHSVEQYKKYL